MIIDTHMHVVAEDQQKYPRKVAAGHGAWVRDMSAQSMLAAMRAAGIDRAIAMQAHGAYEYDNSYAADCAMQYPERLISVCVVDPLHREAPAQLTYWVKERGAQGLRLVALDRDSEWLDDPGTFPLWERAGALELPVCVCMRWRRVPRLRIALERFPSVPVALDHLGAPRLDEGPPYEGMRPLFELARYPNLYVKFSSVSLYAAASAKSTPRAFFTRLLDCFGPDRLMWGSNFPATFDRGLREQLDLAQEELSFLPEATRHKLFAENSQALWPALR